jgi:hypothetical protein
MAIVAYVTAKGVGADGPPPVTSPDYSASQSLPASASRSSITPLATPVTRPGPPGNVYLQDVDARDLGNYRGEAVTYKGRAYPRSLVYGPPYSDDKKVASFELGGRFTTFEATVFLRPGDTPPAGAESMNIEVLADGDPLVDKDIVLGDQPQHIKVDVQGHRWLTIRSNHFYDLSFYAETVEVVWGDARLS